MVRVQRCDGGRTITEELVLRLIPDKNKRTLAQVLVLLRPPRPPVLPPMLLDCVQGGLQSLHYEDVRKTVVLPIVHLDHPNGWGSCGKEIDRLSLRMTTSTKEVDLR